jgi:hypothetical protein
MLSRTKVRRKSVLAQCSCGWNVCPPDLSYNRGELSHTIIGYKYVCIGCTRSTGWRDTLADAAIAWERYAKC